MKTGLRIIIGMAVGLFVVASPVQGISSPNFVIEEDFVGGGGTANSASPGYSARDSIGSAAVGDGKSANNTTQSGATTDPDPMLEFGVTSASVSLGALITSLPRTGTANFSVRNYTSAGYVVQVLGTPPKSGSYTLAGMTSGGASVAGTEQFGINLVANTSPVAFGANPVQTPDTATSFGVAASGYNTPNSFRYNSGDVIASAPKSSGQTDYTISYLANISNNTPAGSYSSQQVLVCTGTY